MNTFMNIPKGTLFGFYRALVVSAEDPEKQGRVRVRIPDIMVDKGWGTGEWCDNGIWARPANNLIGGRNTYDTKGPRCNHQDAWYQGSCMIPPKGSHVFIFFEKGDPSHPFYFAAADYGQTKVLPENRVGPEWWKKWTPIKTREGRTIVISDDPYDARVEITGKKRQIHNTPDGDTQSVFDIDGNQSVFLIDERPSHEKIFLKDYRGNYIKMIQDEGVNDQLHVYFKDDIHLETLKNIYIKAGENIHITASKNIYVTALENMYVKIMNEFREMAHLINRYSETDDNRLAEHDINDNAFNDAARNAANIVRDMAGNMISRNSNGFIADGSNGPFSISSKSTMSVVGNGGTFVDGSFVNIENGSAVVKPSNGITLAKTSLLATLPTPDPSRHFDSEDDGWCPEAPDENPQYKPHSDFWKSHYQWSPEKQSDSSVTTLGGGGGNANVPSTENSSSQSSSSSSATQSSSISQENTISENILNKTPVSINKTINDVLNSAQQEVSKSSSEIVGDASSVAENIKQKIINIARNVSEKVKGRINSLTDLVNISSIPFIKDSMAKLLNLMSRYKANAINKDVINNNPISVDISQQIKGVTDDLRSELSGSSSRNNVKKSKKTPVTKSRNQFDSSDVKEKIRIILNNHKHTIENAIYDQVTTSVNDNMTDIMTCVQEKLSSYNDISELTLQYYNEDFVQNSYNSLKDNIQESLNSLDIDAEISIEGIQNNLNDVYNTYIADYIESIDLSDPIFETTKNNIHDKLSTGLNTFVNDAVSDAVSNSINSINDSIDDIIELVQRDPSQNFVDIVCSVAESNLNESVTNTINDVNNDFIGSTMYNGCFDIDNYIDALVDPLETIEQLTTTDIIKDLNTDIQNGLIDSFVNADVDSRDPIDLHNTSLPELPEKIRSTIADSIPTSSDIVDYASDKLSTLIDDFVDESSEVLRPLSDIKSDITNTVRSSLDDKISIINRHIDISSMMLDYSYLCGWDSERYDAKDYLFNNLRSIAEVVCSNIIEDVVKGVSDAILISNTSPDIQNFLNNVNYRITRGYIGGVFLDENLSQAISNVVNEYFSDCNVNDLTNANLYFNNFANSINVNVSDKLKEDIDYDPSSDIDVKINQQLDVLNNELDNCDGTPVIPNMVTEEISNILQPLYNLSNYSDLIRSIFDNESDTISIYNQFNSLVPTICGAIYDVVYDIINKSIINDVYLANKNDIDSLVNLMNTKNPSDWNTSELSQANEWMNSINSYYNNTFTSIEEYFNRIELVDLISNEIVDEIESSYPTKEGYKDQIINSISKMSESLCSYISNLIKNTILLTEDIENNEFYKDLDLTKIYTIPGVKSSKFKCIPTADDPESMWCDPEVIGGSGCIYEYMLFLKHKFYQTIVPILVNDSIKTIAVSLNPIMEDLKDTLNKDFHDQEIIDAYNNLINAIFNDEEIDLENNKYLKRIDEFMTTCDEFDLTCVVNLMDFSYQSYRWLRNIRDMDKYTHDMADEKFIRYLTILINRVYYKNDKSRRTCRIILNLGKKSFTNPADPENEKYNIYPNCGFIREMIMKLTNNCHVSTNYMSITANTGNNLYYYNPYTEFKTYDDSVQHVLDDYEICLVDCVDNKTNGNTDVIIYDDQNGISNGYAKYFTDCNEKSYPFSYMDDLIEWCNKPMGDSTIIDHYTMEGGEIDANIMNVIFTPNSRKVMRYFYKGHNNYFKYKDLKFDPHTGDVEE